MPLYEAASSLSSGRVPSRRLSPSPRDSDLEKTPEAVLDINREVVTTICVSLGCILVLLDLVLCEVAFIRLRKRYPEAYRELGASPGVEPVRRDIGKFVKSDRYKTLGDRAITRCVLAVRGLRVVFNVLLVSGVIAWAVARK